VLKYCDTLPHKFFTQTCLTAFTRQLLAFGARQSAIVCSLSPAFVHADIQTATATAVTVAGQLQLIAQQLSSPSSCEEIMGACQRLTALIVANPAAEWEDAVARTVILRLLPHVTATVRNTAQAPDESEVAATRSAVTSLCAIASHGLRSTAEALAMQDAVPAVVSAAQAALSDPSSTKAQALGIATAITRGALLPIIRVFPAAIILARTCNAAAQPPLLALATLGGMALDNFDSSSADSAAAVTLVLSVLQCVHAAFSHGSMELLKACCKAGMHRSGPENTP
jgi:hypothetical protein